MAGSFEIQIDGGSATSTDAKASGFVTPIFAATGGGSDACFYENSETVTTNYTITVNKNALSVGPILINSGVTVTVPTGSRWVVL